MQNPQPEDKHTPGDAKKAKDASSPGPQTPLPPQLQNWRVMEVEGQSAPVGDAPPPRPETPPDGAPQAQAADELSDRYDELIVLAVPERRLSIAPGESAPLSASLLNNSDRALLLEVTVRGEVDPLWFPDLPLRVSLRPGERRVFALQVAPPSGPEVRAGDYDFAMSVTPAGRPERCSRALCALTIKPHTDFQLGMLQPERMTTSWWTRSAQAALPITNLSNHVARFEMAGADQGRECVFEFDTPGDITAQTGRATFVLGPGERSTISVTILSRRQPAVSLAAPERPYRVAVQMVEDDVRDRVLERRQVVEGRIVSAALVGPWQLAALAVSAAALLAIIVLTSTAMLLALRTRESPPIAAPAPPPAPAFALVLSMDEPVPTREPQALPPAPAEAAAAQPAGVQPAPALRATPLVVTAPEEGGLPVVQAGQISAPGQAPADPQPAPVRPTAVAVVPSDAGSMTYAQMFQEIAFRYDLNWRMLAALGYVESGFDSNAVGRLGSLGIMQIHPDTWQEWAPLADVSDPFDTYGNVLVAAIYLDYLRATLGQQGRPQTEWMLAAYNWGPDKTLDIIGSGGVWADLPSEVQQYATEVLRIAQSIPEY